MTAQPAPIRDALLLIATRLRLPFDQYLRKQRDLDAATLERIAEWTTAEPRLVQTPLGLVEAWQIGEDTAPPQETRPNWCGKGFDEQQRDREFAMAHAPAPPQDQPAATSPNSSSVCQLEVATRDTPIRATMGAGDSAADPPDDLVRRLREWNAAHVAAFSNEALDEMREAADRLAVDAKVIESLRAECGLRQIQGYNEGKAKAEAECARLMQDQPAADPPDDLAAPIQRLRKLAEGNTLGTCKIISMGDACICALCDLDRLRHRIAADAKVIAQIARERDSAYTTAEKAEAEVEQLTKELEIRRSGTARWVPCSDHRDKVDYRESGCPQCQLERQAKVIADVRAEANAEFARSCELSKEVERLKAMIANGPNSGASGYLAANEENNRLRAERDAETKSRAEFAGKLAATERERDTLSHELSELSKSTDATDADAAAVEAERDALHTKLAAAEQDAYNYREALHRISQWAKAYPLDIFPEPDWKRANKGLESVGVTLSSVSAANMRHVVAGVGDIARAALAAGEKT